jgi:hypothetical protein
MVGSTHQAGIAVVASPEVIASAATTATATRQSSSTMNSYQNAECLDPVHDAPEPPTAGPGFVGAAVA